jgi:hypothetical protein
MAMTGGVCGSAARLVAARARLRKAVLMVVRSVDIVGRRRDLSAERDFNRERKSSAAVAELRR